MLKRKLAVSLIIFAVFICAVPGAAQEQTMGLFINEDDAFVGYTLFSPMSYHVSYLIDNDGLLINLWDSPYRPAMTAYMLENGHLLRTGKHAANPEFGISGGAGGYLQEMAWDGTVLWEYFYSDDLYLPHHDIEPLPNGNVLMIVWEYKTAAEAIAAGRNPGMISQGKLWVDHLIEVEPDSLSGGNIVWEWHFWDHLIQDYDSTKSNYGVVEDHPELLNFNFAYHPRADWNHLNSVDYNPDLDQVLISAHHQNEIYIIDHSTTTQEAAGHSGGIYGRGGDFLYRWGNPRVYRAGNESDRHLFKQHDARWIEPGLPGAGNILIFNNGTSRPGVEYSSVEEIEPPIDSAGNYYLAPDSAYGPEQPVWSYTSENPGDFYSQNLSGAHRLPNGNTLITQGPQGTFFEITPLDSIVWLYINPVNSNGPMTQGDPPTANTVFWATRYAPDYPGFDGQNMTPGDPIELYPSDVAETPGAIPETFALLSNYPNPFNASTTIEFSLANTEHVTLSIYDLLGRQIAVLIDEEQQAGSHEVLFEASDLSSGVYFYMLRAGDNLEIKKMNLLK
jgi:hypothetical protein